MAKVKEGCTWLGNTIVESVFEYDTPKFIHIKSKKVGVVNRLVQLAILGYVIGYGVVYQKGYQDTEIVQSVVTTKVKGASLLIDPDLYSTGCNPQEYYTLDHVDLVVPPHEPNSFFVATNAWVTCNQKMGICGEDSDVSYCNDTVECPKDVLLRAGNGITTGTCNETDTCNIRGWCPLEDENSTQTKLRPSIDAKNFTVLIKNSISFPNLSPNFRRRNIPRSSTGAFLHNCDFNETELGQTCPIFTLKQIVDMYSDEEGMYDELATKGGVIGLRIHWECDLDRNAESCKPEYSARRLDSPTSQISPGFNFRFPKYYHVDGVQHRDVWKTYGIWFVVEVTGHGGRFSFTKLVLVLGSTIGLLAIATIVTDTVTLYVLRKGVYYKKKKYQQVETDEGGLNESLQSESRRENDTDSLKHPLIGGESPPTYGGKMD